MIVSASKKILLISICALFALGGHYSYAQSCTDLSVSESVPSSSLSPCTSVNYFTYTLINSNTSLAYNNLNVTVHLPLGINFSSLNSGLSTTGVSTSSASGTTDPVFTINSLPGNDTVKIVIAIQTPCSPNLARPTITGLDIAGGGLSSTCIYTVTNTVTLATPTISITNLNSGAVNLNTGDIQELIYLVQNPSSAGNIPQLNINCLPDATTQLLGYCISTSLGACGTYNTITGNNIIITGTDIQTLLSNAYSGLGPGQSFYVHIQYKVINCNNGSNGVYTFSWGCGSSTCQTVVTNTDINSFAGTPAIQVTTLTTFDNSSYCPGGAPAIPIGFIYKNLGTSLSGSNAPPAGNAKLTDLVVYVAVSNELGSIDPNTFQVNGNTTFLPNGTVVAFFPQGSIPNVSYWKIDFSQLSTSIFGGNANPFGINTLSDIDGDGAIDDLAEGGNMFTLTVDFTYATICPASFASCSETSDFISTTTKYKNQCGVDITSSYLYVGADAMYFYQSTGSSPSLTAPPDIVEADGPFTVSVCPGFFQRWAPTGFDFDCPNGYHQLNFVLPAGYHLNVAALTPAINGGSMTIPLKGICSGNTTTTTATVTEFPPVGSTPGYIIVNFGKIPKEACGGQYTAPNTITCFDLPLLLDCNSNPSTANFGFDNLSFTLQYVCDAACASCVDNIACASTITYHHCLGPCDWPIFTKQHTFSFKRTTLGLINTPTVYDCNNIGSATTVSPTSPVLKLNAAYPGDAIDAKLEGGFTGSNGWLGPGSTYSSMFLQIRYDFLPSSVCSTPDIFMQDPLKPSIINVSSVSKPSINGAYPVTYSFGGLGGSFAKMNFLLPASLLPLLDTNDILFTADIHLIAKSSPALIPESVGINTFYGGGAHNLSNLRAEFMGVSTILGVDTVPSCDSFGELFTMLQPRTYFGSNSYSSPAYCDPHVVRLYFSTIGALWGIGDDFPGEYRPYAGLDSNLVVTLPPGYTYDSTVFIIPQINYANPANNYFGIGAVNVTLPVTPTGVVVNSSGTTINYTGLSSTTPCWPLLECNYGLGSYAFIIDIFMRPACNTPDTGLISIISGFTRNIQQPVAAYQQHHSINYTGLNNTIFHFNPVLKVTAPATKEAFKNSITFDFTDCNISAYDAPYGWVAFESPGNNILFLNATLPPSLVPLPSMPYGTGGLLVNIGDIKPNECKNIRLEVMIKDTNCTAGLDSILVTWGNECMASAITTTEPICQQGSTYFYFNRYLSTLNLLTPNGFPAGPTALCKDSITYTFLINNPDLGTVTDPIFWMELPAGITLKNAVFTYPYNSTNVVSSSTPIYKFGSSGTDPGWYLDSLFSSILSNGLSGATTNPNNQMAVTITVAAFCDFDPDDYLKFFIGGTSSCSQQLTIPPAEHRPVILNLPVSDSLSLQMSATTDSLDCMNTGLITLTITNLNSFATQHNNILTFSVSDTLNYSNVTPSPSSTIPSGNNVILTWNLPVINSNNSLTFTFNVGLNNNLYCGLLQSNATVGYTDSVFCSSTSTWCPAKTKYLNDSLSFYACCTCLGGTATTSFSNVLCNGSSTGSATVIPAGGLTSYSYSWSDAASQSSANATGLVPGTYTVKVTDINNCTFTQTITITEPAAISLSVSALDATCGVNNGSASINVSGGISGYSYSWSNAATTSSISTVSTGTYTVNVTDANGCTKTTIANIGNVGGATIILNTIINLKCSNDSSGTVVVNVIAGATPYTYSWNTTPVQTTATATGLNSGSYTLIVEDKNNCQTPFTVALTEPPAINLSTTYSNPGCGLSNGSATATVNGGISAYAYSWSTSPAQTTQTATSMGAGTYTVAITDNNGCTKTAGVLINTNPSPVVTLVSSVLPACNGDSTGAIIVTSSSGISPYSYSWNGTTNTTTTISNLSAGIYTVTVTDSALCVQVSSYTITEPAVVTLSTSVVDEKCSNSKGSATAIVSGGTSAYSYNWNTSPSQSNSTATGLIAGSYTITVIDSKNCSKTSSLIIINDSTSLPIATAAIAATIKCFGDSSAAASVSVSSGTSPFTYSWNTNPSQSTLTATGLTAGLYSVVISDTSDCKTAVTVSITQPLLLIAAASATPATCIGINNGTVDIKPTGGTSAYSYSWSNGATTSSSSSLAAGTYTFIVTDANGCSKKDSVVVAAGAGPLAFAGHDTTINKGIVINLNASGGGNYSWTPSTGLSCSDCFNPNATPDNTTLYILTVTDIYGCTDIDSILIKVDSTCGEIFIPTAFSPNGDGVNDLFRVRTKCVTKLYVAIYNRWGEKVFETDDITKGWDGTFKEKLLDPAVFVFYIKASVNDGNTIVKKGNITLVR